MKRMIAALLLLAAIPSQAHAGQAGGRGGKEGGGGFVLVINDQVLLEDAVRRAEEFRNRLDLNAPANA